MYITYIKSGTAPIEHRVVNADLIDELFGVDIIKDEPKFCTTITKETNDTVYAPGYVESRLYHLYGYIVSNKLETKDFTNCYREFKIPKKTGGFRTIDAPNEELSEIQREIAKCLKGIGLLHHDSAFAYIDNRSVVDAVRRHQENNSRWFLKIDLKDFFGSCSYDFIVEQLSKLHPLNLNNYTCDTIRKGIANVACLNKRLPQGTPLSPSLTNYIMIEFDYKITKMLNKFSKEGKQKQRYIYTRYADDMFISAKNKFDYIKIIEELNKIFEGTPLKINENKTRFGSSSGRNWNLGIMLNKDNRMTIGYRSKRRLKDQIYYFIKHGDEWDLSQCQWLLGNLAWLKNIEPDYYKGLLEYYFNKFKVDVNKELLKRV